MNKFGLEFMNKFNIGEMCVDEFFGDDWNLIDKVVSKKGWYEYVNCRGEVSVEYVGEELEDMDELRKSEREFLGSWDKDKNDWVVDDNEIKEDFIDIEEVCYVYVKGE